MRDYGETGPRRRSCSFSKELAADEPAPDFRSARADFVEFCIAPEAPGGRLVDVAHAAHGLDGFSRHPGRLLGRVEDRARRVFARGFAAIERLPDGVHVGAAGGEG